MSLICKLGLIANSSAEPLSSRLLNKLANAFLYRVIALDMLLARALNWA